MIKLHQQYRNLKQKRVLWISRFYKWKMWSIVACSLILYKEVLQLYLCLQHFAWNLRFRTSCNRLLWGTLGHNWDGFQCLLGNPLLCSSMCCGSLYLQYRRFDCRHGFCFPDYHLLHCPLFLCFPGLERKIPLVVFRFWRLSEYVKERLFSLPARKNDKLLYF